MVGQYYDCEVYVMNENKEELASIATGIDAVMTASKAIDSGKVEAMKIEPSFSCNYDLEMTGAQIKAFARTYFPYKAFKVCFLDDEKVYILVVWDMS